MYIYPEKGVANAPKKKIKKKERGLYPVDLPNSIAKRFEKQAENTISKRQLRIPDCSRHK